MNATTRLDSNRQRETRLALKVKVFEVVLHKLASGGSPSTVLEEQINDFLVEHPDLRLVTTHMSTVVAPAQPNAMPRSEESSIILFCTLFYTDQKMRAPGGHLGRGLAI